MISENKTTTQRFINTQIKINYFFLAFIVFIIVRDFIKFDVELSPFVFLTPFSLIHIIILFFIKNRLCLVYRYDEESFKVIDQNAQIYVVNNDYMQSRYEISLFINAYVILPLEGKYLFFMPRKKSFRGFTARIFGKYVFVE